MSQQTDLAALRALVEAVDRSEINCLADIRAECFHDLVHPAQEALERVEETIAQLTRNEAYWRKRAENAEALGEKQMARITRLEEALTTYGNHPLTCAKWEDTTDFKSEPCTCGRDAALEGRDE